MCVATAVAVALSNLIDCVVQVEMLIWDAKGHPGPIFDNRVMLWKDYGEESIPNALSMPAIIEENAVTLRSQYLALVHDLGETAVHDKNLVEHFAIREGFSHWWMSLLAEKCNFSKSPLITDVIKILALDAWVKNNPVNKIKLVSTNKQLAESLNNWCIAREIEFESDLLQISNHNPSLLKRFYNGMPHTLQALSWLSIYVANRWSLRGVGAEQWRKSKGKIAFFSYLFNLVPGAAQQGVYESHYWTQLPKELSAEQIETNWLHIFVNNEVAPTAQSAASTIRRFNKNNAARQNHVLLDSFLSIHVVIRTLRSWLKIRRASKKLLPDLLYGNTNFYMFWPLFKRSWYRSFCGTEGISNLLMYELFSVALDLLPPQNKGIYLQENQGWESGLLASWRRSGHDQIIGFPHSTVRFWDLRRFFDPRIHELAKKRSPLPDRVACSGDAIVDIYRDGNYPQSELIEVEALRYLHLVGMCSTNTVKVSKENSLLVVGDALARNTIKQLELLKNSLSYLDYDIQIVYKPHPACRIDDLLFAALNMKVQTNPIGELLLEHNIVYSSTHTSAAVDAYCSGKIIISMLDGEMLNTSPLRGRTGVYFVSNPEQLGVVLTKTRHLDNKPSERGSYFNLDISLPRWKKLLYGKSW